MALEVTEVPELYKGPYILAHQVHKMIRDMINEKINEIITNKSRNWNG